MAKGTRGEKRADKSYSLAKTKATEKQWELMRIAILAFIKKYPKHWVIFQSNLKRDRGVENKFNLATKEHDKLRKASWRHTASFPIIYNEQGEEIDSLKPVLEKIIPEFTHKHSVNYREFLKRFPAFLPAEKF